MKSEYEIEHNPFISKTEAIEHIQKELDQLDKYLENKELNHSK